MTYFRPFLILILLLFSFVSQGQTVQLIGTSDEFILENVKGYASVEERSQEHEEFNILVFEDKDRELSFYFTFYRGEKVCGFIKQTGKLSSIKEEIQYIKTRFKSSEDNIWENQDKTVHVEIYEKDGMGIILAKALR